MRRTATRALPAAVLAALGVIAGSAAQAAAVSPAVPPDSVRQAAGPGAALAEGAVTERSTGAGVRAAGARSGAAAGPTPAQDGPPDGGPGTGVREAAPAPALVPDPPDGSGGDDGALQDPADDPVLQDALAHDPAREAASPDPLRDPLAGTGPQIGTVPGAPVTGPSPYAYDPAHGTSPAQDGRDQAPRATPSRTPGRDAAATRAPGRDTPPRDQPGRTPGSGCAGDTGAGRDGGPDGALGRSGYDGGDDRPGSDDPCRGAAAEHGVQAGTGGSFTASLPALIGGGVLIAIALCGAAHRMWRRRRADG
ncbi:hypothetical protein [Streptomyces sp. PsTaAH-124]|uniref:hypothetical protein n=1 Tax=Streptomyces sp. PsTaAH-124 TaxID=1157638 RepID=UPI0003A3CFB5|nr:hypothetical protein [Streptomyces sp. PsTaAH-124]